MLKPKTISKLSIQWMHLQSTKTLTFTLNILTSFVFHKPQKKRVIPSAAVK